MIDVDLVKRLIETKNVQGDYVFTGYQIEKETGFSRSVISKLRMGDKDLNNITLGKIIDLFNYAKKFEKELLKEGSKK